MQAIRIKRLFLADFRRNARTLYDQIKRNKRLWQGDLKNGEAYVFVAKSGNQIAFVLRETVVNVRKGTQYERKESLLDVRVWRIEGGQFDAALLEDYANGIGLTLGRKTFAQQWNER